MDSEMIAAAILTAAYISAQRQALTSGLVDQSVKEKYREYLAFVRKQGAASEASASGSAKRKK